METPKENNNDRKQYDALKALTVKATAQHFSVTESYVRMCINGSRKYGRSAEIKIFFDKKYTELSKIMDS